MSLTTCRVSVFDVLCVCKEESQSSNSSGHFERVNIIYLLCGETKRMSGGLGNECMHAR